ncbi:MAG: hypothetical protein J0I77_09660 [Rudaea sp.]|uniref:cytochrome oxidase putative small subunit CydP n=1 Tax=unclassified Rudaea TaxID=2627037 RepID=UPI0010F50D84|nr:MULTISPECIES: cytochrome oxidase putative small subunit CydP [unclassified Rudaea]MBN8885974.1 hypothetical protein [Rudaea sp.]MBR0346859.1 hypothetical protein [Rudaea sp.]
MLRSSPAISPRPDPASSWFRSVEGRRYGRHFLGLIVLKIVLLTALYFVFIAQQPRADTSPDRVFDAIRGTPAAAAPASPPDSQPQSESKP